MTAIVWDQVGDRKYETGVDRGVLYLSDGTAVPWNGLTSIVESRSREVKPYFLDGVKFLDHVVPGTYAAKLSAFTYPDELDLLTGNLDFAPGVTVYDQPTKSFNLSYRTLIGNDTEGVDYGYKIHILYNVIAIPSDFSFDSLGESSDAKALQWDIRGVPSQMAGIRGTNHISIDSRTIDTSLLGTIETRLYGSPTVDPDLPDFLALIALIS